MAKAKTILRAPNLLKPHILAEIRSRGGVVEVGERGKPGADRDLYDIVATRIGVAPHERELTLVDLDPEYHSRVAAGHRASDNDANRNAWDFTMLVAVQQLKDAGLIAKGTRRGRWELTTRVTRSISPEDRTDDSLTAPVAKRSSGDQWFDFQVEHVIGIDLLGADENEIGELPVADADLTAEELAILAAVRHDGPEEQPFDDIMGLSEQRSDYESMPEPDQSIGRFGPELLAFYGEEDGPAGNGYTRKQLLAWSDADWEREHDFIQWLFPTDQDSLFNPDAPVLDHQTTSAFWADPLLRHRVGQSFDRWLAFCGVDRTESGLSFVRPRPQVWDRQNHNWWRVTRVLRSLTILGLTDQAVEFFLLLESVWSRVDTETWSHWRSAVEPIWMCVMLAKSEPQG